MIKKAYLDASTSKEGTYCVAACCFSAKQATLLNNIWRHLLKGRVFHATDLAAKKGQFKDISDEESYSLYRKLVEAVVARASYTAVVSCEPSLVGEWVASNGWRTPYAMCAHLALTAIVQWLVDTGQNDRVAYTLEAGDIGEGELDEYLKTVSRHEVLRKDYRYLSHGFVAKSDLAVLGTADLVAWEWGQYRDQLFDKPKPKKRKMRLSMQHLMADMPRSVAHLTADDVAAYLVGVKARIERIEQEAAKRRGK